MLPSWSGSEKPGAGVPASIMGLPTETELADQLAVAVEVGGLHVAQQTAALSDQHQQAATRVMVLAVKTQVLGELVDALSQQRHLDRGRSGVGVGAAEAADQLLLSFLGQRQGEVKLAQRSRASSTSRWICAIRSSTLSPSTRNGAPRQRAAAATSPAAIRALTLVDDTVSPSTSTNGTTLVSNSPWAASIPGSPRALAPKRKFSPTETSRAPSRSIRTPRTKSSASMWVKSSSNGITTSSSTPRPSITSRLISNGMISFGAASGFRMRSGCGSKVSTVSAPSLTAR